MYYIDDKYEEVATIDTQHIDPHSWEEVALLYDTVERKHVMAYQEIDEQCDPPHYTWLKALDDCDDLAETFKDWAETYIPGSDNEVEVAIADICSHVATIK